MSHSNEFEQVRALVAEVLEVEAEGLAPSVNFITDLGTDSLRVIEILSRLEKAFSVSIDQSHLARMVSLDTVIEVLNEARGAQVAAAA